jgi:DNA-binding response OmpR family regulator
MFLTALATYDDVREGMNLGADDYIVKPFNYRTLSTAVRTRLHKHHSS